MRLELEISSPTTQQNQDDPSQVAATQVALLQVVTPLQVGALHNVPFEDANS